MGEYIKINGQSVKIGTCENLYYTTFENLVKMIKAGAEYQPGNAQPSEYLSEGWRYRFPFPDETGDATATDDFERGERWMVQSDVLKKFVLEMEHHTTQMHMKPRQGQGGGIEPYINIPCPYSADWKGYGHAFTSFCITQQKSTTEAGTPQLWTVVSCPFCMARSRLTQETAQILCTEIEERNGRYPVNHADRIKWTKICAEILRGYLKGNPFEVSGVHKVAA